MPSDPLSSLREAAYAATDALSDAVAAVPQTAAALGAAALKEIAKQTHPFSTVTRYGNEKTRFLDFRADVKRHPKGSAQDKSARYTYCDRSKINAAIIHMTESDYGSNERKFLGTNSHFVVLRDGAILYLHEVEEYMEASNDFNCESIAIEHEGNYPYKKDGNTYKWWSDTYAKPRKKNDAPTIDQIVASRALVTLLTRRYLLSNIYGHRQSCSKVCPGPQLWNNIVKWGVDTLNLNDGGPGYTTSNHVCTGKVIPTHWHEAYWKVDLVPNREYMQKAGPGHAHSSA